LANPHYHLIPHWKPHLANPRRDDVLLLRVSFNSALESLPLYICSQPLTGNSFAIDRLGNLVPFPVLLILSLPLLFGDDDYIGHVWMEVLVLVCSKQTPKLTLWSQTHLLVWC
jgi:hypothetical protein